MRNANEPGIVDVKPQRQLAAKSPKSIRSSQMVNCLRESFAYCEKRARDLLFAAMRDLLDAERNGNAPIILSRLTREATENARRAAQQIQFEFSNWETAGKAVVNAMLGAGVLLTNKKAPVQPGISAQATPITGLKEGFEDETEAYLIELLIRKLGDISTRDHRALAHALFRQFDSRIPMEDFEDRVAVLLASLAGRVTLREDGTYTVRSDAASA